MHTNGLADFRMRSWTAVLVLLVLIATSCRAGADVAQTQLAPEVTPTAQADPNPDEPNPEEPDPEEPAEAEGSADTGAEQSEGSVETGLEPSSETESERPAPFTGERPVLNPIPATWEEPFVLDPDVIEGELANGLSYLIRRNTRPGNQAGLRLVVHAGSLNEAEGTDGAAHFLEHMMFNGTERFPGNDLVQVLEAFGSSFGPDVNAYTSYEETVYTLQVPTESAASLQLGLDVFKEWATAATISVDDVVAERGVVREELRRSAETVNGRIGDAVRNVLFTDTNWLGQEPIGEATIVEAMSDADLRAFYEKWYRPELMTIVAVGDFDPGDVERRIQATFDTAASDEPTEPLPLEVGTSLPEPIFDVFIDSEITQPEVEIIWRLPDNPVTTAAHRRSNLVANIAMGVLNTRLFERLQSGESVLVEAASRTNGFTSTTRIVSVSGQAPADQSEAALRELLTEMERARQNGFTQDELDRRVGELRALTEQDLSESDTRQDNELAGQLVSYALDRGALQSAVDQRDTSIQLLESITTDDLQAFLFDVLDTEPYVVVVASTEQAPLQPDPEELAALYDSTVGFVVEAVERVESAQSELMARPEPAAIVDEQNLGGLSTTVVTYENGVRLAFRSTSITENIVIVRGTSQGGFFAVEGPEVPLLDSTPSLVGGSGFESIDVVALDRLLSGKIASAWSTVGRAEETVNGESSTDDLETLFQLIHLQMTEPTITDLQVRQFNERFLALAENPASSPAVAADLELWRLRYGDSPYFRYIPTVEDLDNLDRDLLLDAYRQRFANAGDFVFSVVGDFDRDELIDLGARYLGTLPDNGVREGQLDRDPGVPEENLVATVAAGVGDQGRVRINWESPLPFTLDAVVAARAVELVVNARLRDLIREQLGASYAPDASVTILSEPKSWVDTIIEVESDPDRVEEVSQVIHEELDRIRAGELDQRYLDAAVEQLLKDYEFFSNREWLDLIAFHTRYLDRPASEYRSRGGLAEKLTIADIAESAAIVFPPTRSVEVRLVPAG